MAKFQFRADQFRAASLIVSKEETRYYLNGVHVEPDPNGGIFMVATDGHKLSCFHDPYGHADRPTILTCDFKSPALKEKRGDPTYRRVHVDGTDATLHAIGDATEDYLWTSAPVDRMMFEEIDGAFPDWRRVVPLDVDPSESGVFSFNGNYLKTIIDSVKILSSDRATQLEIFQKTPTDPAVIRCSSAPGALYVIMPIRAHCESSTPDWLRHVPPSSATEQAA